MWLRCNDTRVTPESDAEVHRASIGGESSNESAYFIIFVHQNLIDIIKKLELTTRDKCILFDASKWQCQLTFRISAQVCSRRVESNGSNGE